MNDKDIGNPIHKVKYVTVVIDVTFCHQFLYKCIHLISPSARADSINLHNY